MNRLPVYTNTGLAVGSFYSTIDIANNYYCAGDEVKLVSDSSQVIGVGYVTNTYTTKFDELCSKELRNMPNLHLRSWTNCAEYFINRFGNSFQYSGSIQIITFVVKAAVSFDYGLSDEQEKELGIPSDLRLGITE